MAAAYKNGAQGYWTRLWFPWKPAFADSDSPWPPDNPGENRSIQHLDLHNEVENDQNSHLKIHEPTFQTSTMAWHTTV